MSNKLAEILSRPKLQNENLTIEKLGVINFAQQSDFEIATTAKALVQTERQVTTQIIAYLEEIESRRIYAKRGYSSLFVFCTEFLGYSEAAASRRISAMRLSKECPEIKAKIDTGRLNLSTVSKAQSFFRQDKKQGKHYSKHEKSKVLESLENKSQREAEKILFEISPQAAVPKERERQINSELTELKLVLNEAQLEKLSRLKELVGRGKSTAELFDWLITRALKKADLLIEPQRRQQASKSIDRSANKPDRSLPQRKSKGDGRGYLSIGLKRSLWRRDQGQCQYRDQLTGKKCLAHNSVEIDHIRPVAMGGTDDPQNLRLLCGEHNRLMAIRYFGRAKMGQYLTVK